MWGEKGGKGRNEYKNKIGRNIVSPTIEYKYDKTYIIENEKRV